MSYRRFRRTVRLSSLTSVDVDAEQQVAGVDRLSNAVCLDLSDIAAVLNGEMRGELPVTDRVLGLFLHETTHHASFANTFGAMISALTTSASWLNGPMMHSDAESGRLSLPSRDGFMLQWLETVYNPLLEGTALFAQYDLVSGTQRVTSHPLLHAIPIFFSVSAAQAAAEHFRAAMERQHEHQTALQAAEAAHDAYVNERITSTRMSEYTLDQKEYLLSQPLVPERDAVPYLLGYLATKRAFLRLRKSFSPLDDTDLFLITMLHFWFSDEGIAALGGRFDDCYTDLVQRSFGQITEHFQDRWDALYAKPKQAVLDAVRAIENSSADASSAGPILDLQLGIRTAGFAINPFAPKFNKHRLTLRYGASPVDLRVDDAFAEVRNISDGDLLGRVPICLDSDRGGFPGSVELVRTYDGSHAAVVVLGPSGLVAARNVSDGSWNEARLVAVFADLPSLDHVKAAATAVEREIWRTEFSAGDMLSLFEFQIEQARSFRNSVHLQIAFPGFPEAQRSEVASLMAKDGLRSIFPTKIRDVASFSLVFGGTGATSAAVADKLGRSPRDVLALVSQFNETAVSKLGIELFEISGNRVTSLI